MIADLKARADRLRELHHADEMLVLPNVWDAASALATGTGTGNGSSTGTGGAVQLWDVTTGQQIGGPLSDDSSTVASVAFSPDGKTLATGSWDGTAPRLWNVGVDP